MSFENREVIERFVGCDDVTAGLQAANVSDLEGRDAFEAVQKSRSQLVVDLAAQELADRSHLEVVPTPCLITRDDFLARFSYNPELRLRWAGVWASMRDHAAKDNSSLDLRLSEDGQIGFTYISIAETVKSDDRFSYHTKDHIKSALPIFRKIVHDFEKSW